MPAGRLERLARFGLLAGEVAIGGLTEAAKRMTGTGTADNSVFVTATNAASSPNGSRTCAGRR